jgi:hypothetical protein
MIMIKSFQSFAEELTFEVDIEGLPKMYVKGNSPSEVKTGLRKIVKQASMISNVTRVSDANIKKVFRAKAQGKEDEESMDESFDALRAKLKSSLKEAKDPGEYDYEGDMAISQLKTIIRHSEHLMNMLEPDTNLPEWVQSKITLATDYMQTAHDYMMSEMTKEDK